MTRGEHTPGIVERLREFHDWLVRYADFHPNSDARCLTEAADLISELVGALNLMFSNFAGHLNDDDYARVEAILTKARGGAE